MGYAVARYQVDLLAFEAALQPLGEDVVGIRYDGLFSLGRSPIDNSRHRADDLVLETGVKCFAHLLNNGSSGCSEFWLVRIAFGWLLRMLVMTRSMTAHILPAFATLRGMTRRRPFITSGKTES
jgi:hypothetical protein